jgi:predicted PurR-regulated permease PerM
MLAQDKLRVYLSVILLASAAWLLHGFIPAMLWAVVIVIATWPLRLAVEVKTKLGDTGVAVVMTSLVAALFFFPIGYVLFHAAKEAGTVTHWMLVTQKTGIAVPEWVHGIPMAGDSADAWWRANLSDPTALSSLIGQGDNASLAEYARRLGTQVAHRLITLMFTIVVIFFLYRGGKDLSRKTLGLLNKLTGESGDRYGLQAAVAIRATVSGLVRICGRPADRHFLLAGRCSPSCPAGSADRRACNDSVCSPDNFWRRIHYAAGQRKHACSRRSFYIRHAGVIHR